ncbi:MAG: hypothetical protein IJZ55_07210 [Lachnospiraceae bacterium]|nr:hypothetical protein [Lachnospiraceae bacterium]
MEQNVNHKTEEKKQWKKWLFPPVWLIVLLTVVSGILLLLVFIKHLETHPVAYGIYVLSFYTVSVLGIACGITFPKQYKRIKTWIYNSKYGNRYMTDAVFKNQVSLYATLMVNILYVSVNVVMYFLYDSMWFVILAAYYGILAWMRFLLLRYKAKHEIGTNRKGELYRAILCAVILLFVNVILSGAVLMILYEGRGFFYHGILIYVVALYTFYVTIYAIINVIKYRKYNSPVMLMAKMIALSAALVSMLSLETAMLTEFGAEMEELQKQILIAATGGGVSVAVVSMSCLMIVKSAKEIKKLRSKQNGAEQ